VYVRQICLPPEAVDGLRVFVGNSDYVNLPQCFDSQTLILSHSSRTDNCDFISDGRTSTRRVRRFLDLNRLLQPAFFSIVAKRTGCGCGVSPNAAHNSGCISPNHVVILIQTERQELSSG
jgi:hypothetical protein